MAPVLFGIALILLAARIGGTSARMAVAGIASGLSRTGIAIVALAVALAEPARLKPRSWRLGNAAQRLEDYW